jgi:hypothetical protein
LVLPSVDFFNPQVWGNLQDPVVQLLCAAALVGTTQTDMRYEAKGYPAEL